MFIYSWFPNYMLVYQRVAHFQTRPGYFWRTTSILDSHTEVVGPRVDSLGPWTRRCAVRRRLSRSLGGLLWNVDGRGQADRGFWWFFSTLKQTLKRHFFRRSLQRKQKWRLEPTSLFRIAIYLTRSVYRLSLEIISEETPKLLLAFLRIVLCLSDRTLKKWRRQKPVRGAHFAPVLVLATVASLWCAWKMGPGAMSFNGVPPPGLDLVVWGREESLHSARFSRLCKHPLNTNGLWEGT